MVWKGLLKEEHFVTLCTKNEFSLNRMKIRKTLTEWGQGYIARFWLDNYILVYKYI